MPETLINVETKRGVHFTVYSDTQKNTLSLEGMMVVLLSDIRDELHTLNTLLGCANFTQMPKVLREVRDRLPVPLRATPPTTKPTRRKAKR